VVLLTNQQRQLHGLPVLVPEQRLALAASQHSADMAARRFFDHRNPDGHDAAARVVALGYQHALVVENISAGQRSPAEVVTAWMNNPVDRSNLLLPAVTQLGVGYAADSTGYPYYWTQVLAAPRL
jgi:uncharacterized protein YkwD